MPGHELVHWRPAGWQITACGAPHVPAQAFPARQCCRTDPAQVTCPDCKTSAATVDPAQALMVADLLRRHPDWSAPGGWRRLSLLRRPRGR